MPKDPTRRGWRAPVTGAVLLIAAAVPASAQQGGAVTPKPNQVPMQDQNAKPGEPLSDTLSRSGGVIKPPAGIDPDIRAPAPEPNPNTTPVIPPPGTPGGNPNLQPK